MKTKLRVIYAAPAPGWGSLFTQKQRDEEISTFRERMGRIKALLPGVEFVEEDLRDRSNLSGLDEDRNADGILFLSLSEGTDEAILKLMDSGLPMILYVEPYSWHVWCREILRTHRNAQRLMLVSSSDFNEVVEKIRVIDALTKLKRSKILLFDEREGEDVKLIYGADSIERYVIRDVERKFGVRIEKLDKRVILDAYQEVDDEEVRSLMEVLMVEAEWVVEPSRDDILKALKLYLAMKKVVKERGASGLTIDCLAMLHALPTTPCLGFSLLNDEGICAACEADLNSLLTMLILRYLAGVPSFITDPVIDTARNTVIHAHCVAPRRMDGENSERFIIRNHSESRTGVSLQVKMRVGQKVTVAKFADLGRMLLSTGTIVDNPDLDRGCRTKVEVSVPDAKKLLRTFSGGLHRVLAYGDHVEGVEELCRLLGIEVIREG